jgi:hypothetical protein
MQITTSPNGARYYDVDYEIVLLFGLTELKAQIAYRQNVRQSTLHAYVRESSVIRILGNLFTVVCDRVRKGGALFVRRSEFAPEIFYSGRAQVVYEGVIDGATPYGGL